MEFGFARAHSESTFEPMTWQARLAESLGFKEIGL